MKRIFGFPGFIGLCMGLASCVAEEAGVGCDIAAPRASEAGESCQRAWADANVSLNQLQAIGTHNSFKIGISAPELAAIAAVNPDAGLTLDYAHPPLADQLDAGARQLELDPYFDPDGGRYANPLGPRLLAARGLEVPPFDLSPLNGPGLKVIHTTDIDYRSHCLTFVACLQQVKAWSDTHPDHSPILLMINTKSGGISWDGATEVLPFGRDAFDQMDDEILSVFPRERVVTPDEVRGDHETLREAVIDGGWPKLGVSRGRVIFGIDNNPEITALYAEGHPSLAGRMAFINTDPDSPEAGYFTMNEPLRDLDLIRQRVKQGFLVRTRADADTREARSGDASRREAAFASGAHYVSTDYMRENPDFGTGYQVTLPGGGAMRCNPVNAPEGCDVAFE